MKIKILNVLCFFCVTAHAVAPYPLKIERGERTYPAVAGDFWQGEYPMPVLVARGANGVVKVPVRESLRVDPSKTRSKPCTIRNGQYHPWAKDKVSAVTFYTVVPLRSFKATKAIKIEDTAVPTNAELQQVFSLAEGTATAVLVVGGKKETIEFAEESVLTSKDLLSLAKKEDEFTSEQWIYVKCNEGHKGFIRDEELQKTPGVVAGEIQEYGALKPVK